MESKRKAETNSTCALQQSGRSFIAGNKRSLQSLSPSCYYTCVANLLFKHDANSPIYFVLFNLVGSQSDLRILS